MEVIKFSDFINGECKVIKKEGKESMLADTIWIAITIAVIIASVKLGLSIHHPIGFENIQPPIYQ